MPVAQSSLVESPLRLRQAIVNPNQAAPRDMTNLQQAVGNRAVSALIQPKLIVGAAHDPYEQEADRVSNQVMRMPATLFGPQSASARIQRLVNGSEDSFEVGDDVQQRINASRGGGQPLSANVRDFMEPRFGADFSQVRLHNSPQSTQLNRSIQAKAFTLGSDIFLDQNYYSHGTQDGMRLLAHELTHVVQQGGAKSSPMQPSRIQRIKGQEDKAPPPVEGPQVSDEEYHERELEQGFTALDPTHGLSEDQKKAYLEEMAEQEKQKTIKKPGLLSRVGSSISGGFSKLGKGLKSGAETVGKGFVSLGKGIKSGVETIGGGLTKAGKTIGGGLATAGKAIKGGVETAGTYLGKKVGLIPLTPVEEAIARLKAEFKGLSIKNFARTSQVTFDRQSGRLWQSQDNDIHFLAKEAPKELTALGFLMPEDARKKALELKGKPDELAKLPVKQQMQVYTAQLDMMEISAPVVEKKPTTPSEDTGKKPTTEEANQKLTPKPKEGTEETSKKKPSEVEEPSSENIVIKPGEEGEETAEHNLDGYRNILWDYVRQAGKDLSVTRMNLDIINQDYLDVKEGRTRYDEMDETSKKQSAQIPEIEQNLEKAKTGKDAKATKELENAITKLKKQVAGKEKDKKSLLSYLHEENFTKAESTARHYAEFGEKADLDITQEKATIEYIYDEIEDKRSNLSKKLSGASRKVKKDANFRLEVANLEKRYTDEAKNLTQQAVMSHKLISIRRAGINQRVEDLKKIGRLPGTFRKLMGKIVVGVLGGATSAFTGGLITFKADTNAKGFMGKGLDKQSSIKKGAFQGIKISFFWNEWAEKWREMRANLAQRPTGMAVYNWASVLLRGINELFLAPIIKMAGTIALWSGLIALIPYCQAAAGVSAVATMVALAAGAVKILIDGFRLTLDGLAALFNKNAKLQNMLSGRFAQTGLESISDVVSTAGTALGPGVNSVTGGGAFINPFDLAQSSSFIAHGVGHTTSIGTKIAQQVTSKSVSIGAPTLGGPVLQGIGAATTDLYNVQTKSDFKTGNTSPGWENESKLNKKGDTPIDTKTPDWVQKEMKKQNELQSNAFKSQTIKASGMGSGIMAKLASIASRFSKGKSDNSSVDSGIKKAKSDTPDLDEEAVTETKSVSSTMDLAQNVAQDSVGAIGHLIAQLKENTTGK
ncbi:MAG TPA: DUF4157 domain-containing protein [Anaerolineaceae bacterium]|nr:DUF4157 domain-containing protein [Anaerolineaceae bacterium]HPN52386.1 DUF4157 domain-containing protein [Anaerolineaceae bacterium]